MKLKNTLVLLILAGGLFAFIKFYESHQLGTKDRIADAGKITKFDRDQMDSISIKNSEAKIELRKDGKGVWRLEEPVKDRADSVVISQLFTAAESLRFDAMIGDQKDGANKDQLKEFGLSNSEVKLKFTGKDKPVELVFGKDAAVEGKIYVKSGSSDAAYVIGKDLKDQISKKVDDFRDRKLSDVLPSQVHKVAIKTASGEIQLEKKDSHWTLTKPLKARADDSKVGDFISQALTARVDSFVADSTNASSFGLQEPRATISFFVEGQEQPTVLQVGANPKDDKEKVYAKLSSRDSVVLVPKALESTLTTKPNDLRDRALVRFEADIVDRITIESSTFGKIVLARSSESWVQKVDGKDVPINVAAAQRLLEGTRSQEVSEFVSDVASDLGKYGLDNPITKVTFSSYASENTAETKAGDKPIATLLIGGPNASLSFAKLEDEPFIVSVHKEFVDLILTDPIQWRPLEIHTLKADDIVSLEVSTGTLPVVLEKDKDKGWQLTKGDGKVNKVNAQALVDSLAALRAVRWVGATTNEHGMDLPVATISYKTSGNVTGKLKIGRDSSPEMAYATVDGQEGTFIINLPDSSAFLLPLIEKPATPVVPTTPAPATPAPAATTPPEPPVNPAPAPAPAPTSPQ